MREPSSDNDGAGGRPPRLLPQHDPWTQPPCVRGGLRVVSSRQYDLHIHSARVSRALSHIAAFLRGAFLGPARLLSARNPPLRVDDVIQDLRDGTKLLALLEILSGQVLPRERARILRRPHFLSNVNTVLRFLEQRRIKLVNINATDVVDGKPAILLGLIWTIILHFQIEEHTRLLAGSPAGWEDAGSDVAAAEQNVLVQASPKRPTPIERWRGGARKALLHWVKNSINQRFGVQVNDFGPSWRDGLAFLAIVHCIQPSLIELDSVKKMEPRGRLETAFSLAHRELGIPRLLDPEDVDVPQPDERSVMTYVAQFLHKYPGTYAPEQPLSPTLASPTAAAPPGMQPDDLSVLESFLKRAEDTLLVLGRPLTNVREEYLSYLGLCREVESHRDLYGRLQRRAARSDGTVLSQAWPLMEGRWKALEAGLAQWRLRLDRGLPGRLAQVAEWLAQTEEQLRNDPLPQGQLDGARWPPSWLSTRWVGSDIIIVVITIIIVTNTTIIVVVVERVTECTKRRLENWWHQSKK
ncbi:muscle-specific protein 300 kDa isoform X2 [Ixodes scapularis]